MQEHGARWVVCMEERPDADYKLICVPYAGGGCGIYKDWTKYISADYEVHALSLPGHGKRMLEKPLDNMEELIRQAAGELYPIIKNQKFILFGHSMGALIAYELTRYMQKCYGESPIHLFVSAFKAPRLCGEESREFVLSDNELTEKMQMLGSIAGSVLQNKVMCDFLLPTMKADLKLCRLYCYVEEEPLVVPITAFYGTRDEVVSKIEVEAWETHTFGGFRCLAVEGEHLFVNEMGDRMVSVIMKEITEK